MGGQELERRRAICTFGMPATHVRHVLAGHSDDKVSGPHVGIGELTAPVERRIQYPDPDG